METSLSVRYDSDLFYTEEKPVFKRHIRSSEKTTKFLHWELGHMLSPLTQILFGVRVYIT